MCRKQKEKKANPGIPALLTGTPDGRCALKTVRGAKQTRSRMERPSTKRGSSFWCYLCVVSTDVEEVEREDVVLGSHHQSPPLLVQQEGVVGRAVGQTLERHKVVRLQHFCEGVQVTVIFSENIFMSSEDQQKLNPKPSRLQHQLQN